MAHGQQKVTDPGKAVIFKIDSYISKTSQLPVWRELRTERHENNRYVKNLQEFTE